MPPRDPLYLRPAEFQKTFRLARQKNEDAFEKLYREYSQWVIKLIRYGLDVDNREDADDIALAVWEKAWRRIPKFPRYLPANEATFLQWLRRLATHTAFAYQRRLSLMQETLRSYSYLPMAFTEDGEWFGQRVEFQPASAAKTSGRRQIQFTAYYPKEVQGAGWSRLLLYTHLRKALEEVQADSEERLGFVVRSRAVNQYAGRPKVDAGTEIAVIPEIPGFRFNPRSIRFQFLEDWHCSEFRFRNEQLQKHAKASVDARSGQISLYVGPLLIGEIPIVLSVKTHTKDSHAPKPRTRVSDSPFQTVFASYSHKDSEIVGELEKAYVALGLRYTRDVSLLRSGEIWDAKILDHIESADIFQLFWSRNSAKSKNVQGEWKHALMLRRKNFIRPLYWHHPMPPVPKELKHFHFSFLNLSR